MQEPTQVKPMKNQYTELEILDGIKDKNHKFEMLFYEKYVKSLYKMMIVLCKNYSDPGQLALDVTQETFISAFRGIQRFNFPENSKPSDHGKLIMGWLKKIASNCFKKEYAKRINEAKYVDIESLIGDPHFDIIEEKDKDEAIIVDNPFRLKLQNALNLLTERERHIILQYADEECILTTNHLSESSMQFLCELYETTSDNIRQIKKRSLDKIMKSCKIENH